MNTLSVLVQRGLGEFIRSWPAIICFKLRSFGECGGCFWFFLGPVSVYILFFVDVIQVKKKESFMLNKEFDFIPVPISVTVDNAVEEVENLVRKFAKSTDFDVKIRLAFGDNFDVEKVEKFASAWAGDFGTLPAISIRDSGEINGARGAFAAATNTIYLSREFVRENEGNVDAIASVILEEYGHYIDSQINVSDSAGDEGEIFAALAQGKVLSESELADLKGEDDSAVVILDGEEVRIEQAVEQKRLDFSADDLSFESFGKFRYEDLKGNINPSGQFNTFGLKFDWNLNASAGLIPFVDLGKPGMATFRYPINVDAELPNEVSNNEEFSLKLLPNFTVGGASINGSGLELPSAGIDLSFNVGSSGIRNVSFSNSDGSVDQLGDLEFSGLQQPIEKNLITKKLNGVAIPGIPLGEFGEIQITIPDPSKFKPSGDLETGSINKLPELSTNKNNAENFVNLQLDLDRIAAFFVPQLKVLGGKLSFPNAKKQEALAQKAKEDLQIQLDVLRTLETPEALQEAERLREKSEQARKEAEQAKTKSEASRNRVDFSYDLLDIKGNLGLALRQDFTFEPDQVRVTMSVEGQGEQTGMLGDPSAEFKFKAPSDGCGVLEVKAKYELFGNLKNELGLAPKGSLEAKGLEGNLAISFGGFSPKPLKIGPLLPTLEIPKGGLVGKSKIKIAGPDAPIKINPIDITATGQEDVTRNLVIEKTYKIPYNLPVSVSDTSVTEGNSGTKDMVFAVTLRDTPKEAVTLSYSSPKGSGTITIAAGQSRGEIKIPVTGDTAIEADETFTLTVKDQNSKLFADCKGTDSAEATGTIIDDDQKPEPSKDGGKTYNDPRIVTLDKQYHDFQAAGEFILTQSTSGDLKIQVRQQPVGNNPRTNVSDNTAVATVLGGKRIAIYRDKGLLIDGISTEIPNNEYLPVGDGRIYREGNIYTIVYPTGDQLVAKVIRASRVNVSVYLTEQREGQVVGLLGNFNRDPKDDLAKRDGTVISQPVTLSQLYGEYADSWRISQAESLFDYQPGEDTNTFTNRNYPRQKVTLSDLNPADIQRAELAIGDRITNPTVREAAIIDYILTGFDQTVIEEAIASFSPESVLAIVTSTKAVDDFAFTTGNTPVNIDVLLNDTGTIGTPLSIANFDQTTTAGGTVKLDNNNTPNDKTDDKLTYTPPTNFTGNDTFNYTLTDGTQTDTAKVTVNIPTFNLSNLNGNNGFTLKGINAGNFAGVSVNTLGDFNGDGFHDFIIGAFGADPNNNNAAGETYVVFGKQSGFPANIDLPKLDGNNGFILNGIDTNGFSGSSVSSAGDINNDGLDDLIIGAFGATANGQNNAGKTHILFGTNQPLSATFNLANLTGTNGFTINGSTEFDYLGLSLSSAGDINNDGIDDIAIIAPGPLNSGTGKTYIIYGKKGNFSPNLNLTDIKGTTGFVINSNGNSPISVSDTKDINGDNIDDLIIGTETSDPTDKNKAGKSHIIFGSKTLPDTLNLSDLNGQNGLTLTPPEGNSNISVNKAGDINGDGIGDLIIALSEAQNTAFKSYIVFGTPSTSANLNLNQLNGGNGFTIINGIDGNSLTSISGAGDVNGDGIDDLIAGVSSSAVDDKTYAGKSYVIFGKIGGFAANFNLETIDGNNGFIINGAETDDLTGTSATSAGDINGDSIDDIILGSPGNLFNNAAGKSYVVFGNANFGADKNNQNLEKLLFDPKYYLTANPDIAAAIAAGQFRSALAHFSTAGYAEGRSPNAYFATEYLSKNPDVAGGIAAGTFKSGFEHFIKKGFAENRQPEKLSKFALLDTFYLAENPDVSELVKQGKFSSGLEHLIRQGMLEGRNPIPRFTAVIETFDSEFYRSQNPDVVEAINKGLFRNELEHFMKVGMQEGRNPGNSFSNSDYLAVNPDIADAVSKGIYRSGFEHYMKYGFWENRPVVQSFDFTDFANFTQQVDNTAQFSQRLNPATNQDALTGTNNTNILTPTPENNILTGTPNNDIFTLTKEAKNVNITGYQDNIDLLGLSTGLTFEKLTITQSAGDTLIKFNDEVLATITGIPSTNITSTDFTLI